MSEKSAYALREPVSSGVGESVPAGTALLVTGEPAHTRDVLVSSLRTDPEEGALFVTDAPADEALATCAERAERYWFVATDGDPGGRGAVADGLSDVAVSLSELLTRAEDGGVDRLRIVVDDLDALLADADPALAFRFLHLFTGRVRTTGLFAVVGFDPQAHDPTTVSNVRALFDGVLEVRSAGDGREARLRGIGDADGEWAPIE